jgi:hypothetical protein
MSQAHFDRFSWAISLLLTSLQVLVYNAELFTLLEEIERSATTRFAKSNPILAQRIAEQQKYYPNPPTRPSSKSTPRGARLSPPSAKDASEPPELFDGSDKRSSSVEIPALYAELNGRIVLAFTESMVSCVFKPNFTVKRNTTHWGDSESDSARSIKLRLLIVRALLRLTNLSVFTSPSLVRYSFPVSFGSFSPNQFLISVCQIATSHLKSVDADAFDETAGQLLKASLALTVRLFPIRPFKAAIPELPVDVLLRAFSLGPTEYPLFEPVGVLDSEAISFLYIVALVQPEFVKAIATQGYSNTFVFNLVFAAKEAFDSRGFSYLHSIVIGALLLILFEPKASENLSEPCVNWFDAEIQPPGGSFADLLLGVLCYICTDDALWGSLLCVFHMIAPYVSFFTPATAQKILALCAQFFGTDNGLTAIALEAFAAMLQRDGNEANAFLPAIVEHPGLFALGNLGKTKAGRALAVLQKFLAIARKRLPKGGGEMAGLAMVKIPEKVRMVVSRRPHVFAGELEKGWSDWTDFLFASSVPGEVEKMRNFQFEYEPKLVSVLGIQ